MSEGKLVVNNKNLQIQFINAKGKEVKFNIKETELSVTLLDKKKNAIAQLNDLEVEFEEVGGQPKQVREKGKTFGNSSNGDFHNPYNFVPAPPRNTDKIQNSELGDRAPVPVGHSTYLDNYWSGKISVTLTTVTPLLIPDAANATGQDHKTYPIRLGLDGKPYLAPTSIKGMLRSAYEAITNSRLSIFEKHHKRLFYRMGAGDGLSLVPARIEGDQVKLLSGTTSDIPQWNEHRQRWQIPQNEPMYAAWLPRYRQNNRHNLEYDGMNHGDHVKVWLELYKKQAKDGRVLFQYWLVRKIVPFEQNLGSPPVQGKSYGSHVPAGRPMIETDGYVCITNRNMENKHDERVFFSLKHAMQHQESFAHLVEDWKYLINNYQEIHLGQTRDNNLEWSRQILGGAREGALVNGTLCYAYVEKSSNGYTIKHLYPVMISRAIFDSPPDTLLSPNSNGTKDLNKLKPAERIKDLSPADRVFGWVNQNRNGSYKGQLRISSVKCDSDKDFDKDLFQDGLPLAILGEPKPEQVRFYVAETSNGEPLQLETKKSEGYQSGQGLRGRKFYPHHQLPIGYWDINSQDNEINGYYREYLRVDGKQDSQNRSIKSWVNPETKFSFEIDVINLSTVELGALLWLLQLSNNFPEHFYRLGGGKPLGFGSVQLNIEDTDLRTGLQWREFYQSLIPIQKPEQATTFKSIEDFQRAVEVAYENTFIKVSFISAFLQAARGFAKPIHYPRLSPEPKIEDKSYEWFVANENDTKAEKALKLSLPHLTQDLGLPILPKVPKSK